MIEPDAQCITIRSALVWLRRTTIIYYILAVLLYIIDDFIICSDQWYYAIHCTCILPIFLGLGRGLGHTVATILFLLSPEVSLRFVTMFIYVYIKVVLNSRLAIIQRNWNVCSSFHQLRVLWSRRDLRSISFDRE